MRGLYISLGAVALATVNAWEYPFCEHDGCYRNMIDSRFEELSEKFCPQFLSGTTTAPSAIPTEYNNCDGNIAAISSACSCITYSASTSSAVPTTSATSTVKTTTTGGSAVPTTTTTYVHPASSSSSSAQSTTSMTTSTITTTRVYTITSCAPTVTDCPVGHVTSTIETTVTVCPVTEVPPPATIKTSTTTKAPTTPVGTGGVVPTKTSATFVPVNSAVGRFAGAYELAAAAGAVVVALL